MSCRPAPACVAALKEATIDFPNRYTASDGICGDQAHQKRKSDHNVGEAFDLTHDPLHGVDAHKMVRDLVKRKDPRIKYVITNWMIWSRTFPFWRPYVGVNGHTKHAHVSILPDHRNDTREWWKEEYKVRPKYDPAKRADITEAIQFGKSGILVLEPSGRVKNLNGAPHYGDATTIKTAWGDRKAARIKKIRSKATGKVIGYKIVATTGEEYNFRKPKK